MKSNSVALYVTDEGLSLQQLKWVAEVKGCDEVISVSGISQLFLCALLDLVQPRKNLFFVRRATAAKQALSNRFTRRLFQEVSVIDFYIDERFLATRCLQGSFFLKSDICARKLEEKAGDDVHCYVEKVFFGRTSRKGTLDFNPPNTLIFISQCTPNILDGRFWDAQSEWAMKNFKFLCQLLPLIVSSGYEVAIKLRDNESRENQVKERDFYVNLCSDFSFLSTASDMAAFADEKNNDVLYLCSHSTLGIDLTLRDLQCLFVHHSIYPGYDLVDFGCDVFIGDDPQLALKEILGRLAKEKA